MASMSAIYRYRNLLKCYQERWLPVHTVETILLSVISMLADPNYESPANVDAAVSEFRR